MKKRFLGITVVVFLFLAICVNFSPDSKAGTYPPGISYSSLLNGVKMFPKKGTLQLHHIQATFLPGPKTKGYIILSKADGTKLYRTDFKVEQLKSPYYLIDFMKKTDLRTNKRVHGGYGRYKIAEAGAYRLDFYCCGDKKFYTFPFKVSRLKSADPFSGGDLYFLEGDWSDWGYLYYYNADPSQNLVWKMWLRNKSQKRAKDAKVKVKIFRDSDGKQIVESRDATYSLRHRWNRFAFDLTKPMKGTSGGRYFKAKDLLAHDGSYTLKVFLNGGHYGTWKFKVKDGRLNQAGRTVRGKADPFTFIEGGKDAFWYKKQ